MKSLSEKSRQLYKELEKKGYPLDLCDAITQNLNTDYTAGRMLGYLSYFSHPPVVELVDEMLSILADRDRFVEKKKNEYANAKWNEYLNSKR